MEKNNHLEEIAKSFVEMLQNRQSAKDMLPFYHPDIEQTEFPNAVTAVTTTRNLDQLKAASEKGRSILLKEEYDIRHSYTIGHTVILETIWTGTLAVPVGKIPAGGHMKAYFAQFFEFEGDKIRRIRNYDCFEPFQ